MSTNFSFDNNDPTPYLIIFDNVLHTGQMACNTVAGHTIWYVNSSSTAIQEGCQNLLIPVEKIDKQSPAPLAAIGMPFTYTLTIPILYNAATGDVINSSGSVNDLHSIIVTDDLNALGVDLTYLSHRVYWKNGNTDVSHSFSNVGGLLTFDNFAFNNSVLPAGEQIVIEITVVLNDTSVNSPGKVFTNIAQWSFGRYIGDTYYEPLPGESGISAPMTIVEPNLVVTKTSSETATNFGVWVSYTIDVENRGGGDAWDSVILDQLPDGASGGMCDSNPIAAPAGITAQIFAANGDPVSGLLVEGTDYLFSYSGPSTCQLSFTMLTDKARIAPDEHLIITYQNQLDSGTQNGLQLTNVAGATEWFSADSSNTGLRHHYGPFSLSDGTPGVPDFQDSETVTAALSGYYFQKTVENVTNGLNPASTAAPGDRLLYRLRLFNIDQDVNEITIRDPLDPNSFDLATFAIVTPPPSGALYNFDPVSGLLEITGDTSPLNVLAGGELLIEFEITLKSTLTNGTEVSNQASLYSISLPWIEPSDDPYVNGIAMPLVQNDEDPTTVLIQAPGPMLKANTQGSVTIGEQFKYQITVPASPVAVPLYDVQILDDLSLTNADLRFVSANALSGGTWTLSNTGSAANLVIEDTAAGIDIPANGQAVIEITVELENTTTNQSGLSFANSASYTYNRINGNNATQMFGGTGSTIDMNVVEPDLSATKTVSFVTPVGKPPTDPAMVGDVLEYQITIANNGNSVAYDTSVVDTLPANLSLVADSATAQINGVDVTDFVTTPTMLAGGVLAWGQKNFDFTLDIPVGQMLVLTYQVSIVAVTASDINNSVYVDWTSLDGGSLAERTGAGCPTIDTLNDYCYGPTTVSVTTLDNTSISILKSVVNETTGGSGANAAPGDTLRYTLLLTNQSDVPSINVTVVDDLDAQFAPGSLELISISDTNADATGTNATGGVNGTGVVDIRNLTLDSQGSPNDSITIVYEATLSPVIQSGTTVRNQALVTVNNLPSKTSNITSTLINSAPAFEVLKTSQDITGDPAELIAGDLLRYTITIKNTGNENAVNTVLQDQIPTYTTYVDGTTRLNGALVADPIQGVSALQSGMMINAIEDTTAGFMRADSTATTSNVATVTFEVMINSDVVDGTIIANQGFVNATGAGSGPAPEEPSDDPATPVLNDPTLDVVGNVPLVDAQKTVQILIDNGSTGVVDPGDRLQYTITITNAGAAPASGVIFTDAVPMNTTYVPNSVQLNGLDVGQPDDGISPLVSGIAVSSSDLTPPLPSSGNGTLSIGSPAVITFEVDVNAGVAGGTVISNQGYVASTEQTTEPTDADGIDSNGDQPTQVVVGNAQLLSILKEVFVVGGGAAVPGSQLEYVIRVTNIGSLPATDVVVTDDLDAMAGQVTYVAGSGTLNGSTAGVTYAAPVLTADYSAQYGNLPQGASAVVRFRVQIDPTLAIGTRLENEGYVTWNDGTQSASARVSIDVGGTPGSAALNGSVWHDADFDDEIDDGIERRLVGWSVELYRNNRLLATVLTDTNGVYRLTGLAPNAGASEFYDLRFRAPGAGPNTASMGDADSSGADSPSPFIDGPQQISAITVASGANLQNLNLPISPNGAVYNSVVRIPVVGARLALLNATTGAELPSQCFDDPTQQNQVTTRNGFYKFDLNFSDASCPAGGGYIIDVTPPATGYVAMPSQIIPPGSNAPFSVPDCPGSPDDAVPATTDYCEVVATADVPPPSVLPRTANTIYHLDLLLDNGSIPGQSQIFNNFIPIDPVLGGAVAITKTSSLINVTRGDLVPYTITVTNVLGAPLYDIGIVDRFPYGFKYVAGSARLNGNPAEPNMNGQELSWDNLDLQVDSHDTIKLLLIVGSGVSEGEYVNQAQVVNNLTGGAVSGVATATVRVIPDPDFDCTDVIGKVFDDRNFNGQQDMGEKGLQGARVVTVRGLKATADKNGRFHITCAAVPNEDRGSNLILKLDERSLPTGYRMTTENPRVQRATRGKMIRFNFGATIHRVVRLDIADGVFEPNTTELRLQWTPRVSQLIEELKKAPSVLRLSYLADVEEKGLVRKRLDSLKKEITSKWKQSNGGYRLTVETEIFWRRGGPLTGK